MEQVVRGKHVGVERATCAQSFAVAHGSFVVWAVYMSELTAPLINIRAESQSDRVTLRIRTMLDAVRVRGESPSERFYMRRARSGHNPDSMGRSTRVPSAGLGFDPSLRHGEGSGEGAHETAGVMLLRPMAGVEGTAGVAGSEEPRSRPSRRPDVSCRVRPWRSRTVPNEAERPSERRGGWRLGVLAKLTLCSFGVAALTLAAMAEAWPCRGTPVHCFVLARGLTHAISP